MLKINAKGLSFNSRKPKKIIFITIIAAVILSFTTGAVVYYSYKAERQPKEVAIEHVNTTGSKIVNVSNDTTVPQIEDNPIVGEEPIETEQSPIEASDPEKEIPAVSKSDYEVNFEDIFKKDGIKTAFLTFDDGPTRKITPQVMEILNKYNIKASFFVMGQMADKYPELIKKQYEEGHAICIHSYYHDYDKMYNSEEFFKNDLEKSITTLKNILGQDFSTRIYRFPGGGAGKSRAPYKEILKEKGFVQIDWNALNGDSEWIKENGKKRTRTAPELIERLKDSMAKYGNPEDVVILMHDAAAKQATVDSLPQVIEYLQEQGYIFKTMK